MYELESKLSYKSYFIFLLRLSQTTTWWMDGTFSSNPAIFCQLYTVHIKLHDEFIAQLWCLLPDKTGATYTRLFRLLKQKAVQLNLQLQPLLIHIDFEQSVMQAIRTEFQIEPSGCLFPETSATNWLTSWV